MNFTQEQLAKAKAAKSAEELIALAKENGMELSEEEAKKFFAELNKEGTLADDELDNVSGGCGGGDEDPHAEHLAFCPTVIDNDSVCPVCGGYINSIKYVTSKSGYSSYFVLYCPNGEVYFDRTLQRNGYLWQLDKEMNG